MHILQNPEYKTAVKDLDDLNAAHVKIEARIHEINLLLKRPEHLERENKSTIASALKFLRTGTVEQPSFDRDALHEELQVLYGQARSVKQAVQPAWGKRDRIQTDLSVQYCRTGEIADRHKKLARRCIQKLLELDAIYQEEQSLMIEIQASGFNQSFPLRVFEQEIGMVKGESPNKTRMDNMLEDLTMYCMSTKEKNDHIRKVEENRRLTEKSNQTMRANAVNQGVIDLGDED